MLDKNLPTQLLKMVENGEEYEIEDLAYDLGLTSKASETFLELSSKYWQVKKAEKKGLVANCPGAVEMMKKIENGISAKDLEKWLIK